MTPHARTRFQNLSRLLPGIMLGALAALGTGCESSSSTGESDALRGVTAAPPTPADIAGTYIAVICDADMGATAFADGVLARRSESDRDMFALVRLPLAPRPGQEQRWSTGFVSLEVSNSVIGSPTSLAITRDGKTAYVAESRGPAGPGARTMRDLAAGSRVSIIDLSNPAQPKVTGRIDVGGQPTSVDIHPSGRFVAIARVGGGQSLVIVPITPDGLPGAILTWSLPAIDPDPDIIADKGLGKVSSVVWHPDSRHLAVTVPSADRVVFYEFTPDGNDGAPGIALWGQPVPTGPHPLSGQFTPDGKDFITTDLHWGPNVDGYLVGAPQGSLSVIRLAAVPSGNAAKHELISSATVGISPEGLAISPDGRWVVTANLKRAMLPDGDPRMTPGGSLSLLSRDPATGTLTAHAEIPINAMPEGIAFDTAGRHIIVPQFRTFDPGAVDGELAFFKLVPAGVTSPDAGPTLIPANFTVGVGIGPHGVLAR